MVCIVFEIRRYVMKMMIVDNLIEVGIVIVVIGLVKFCIVYVFFIIIVKGYV